MLLAHIRAFFRGTHASMLADLKDVKNRLTAHSDYKSTLAAKKDRLANALLFQSAAHEKHADELFVQAVKIGEIINP